MEILLIVVSILFILYFILIFNIFTKKKNAINNAKSLIEIYLTQRFDLIPNLQQCTKKYMKYESETLENLTKLRVKYINEKTLKNGGILNDEINNTVIILENYPELKASEQFMNLQKNLTRIENQLQAARRIYNQEVEKYNHYDYVVENTTREHLYQEGLKIIEKESEVEVL